MKRRLFKLVLFLLLGAIVNVGVAWGLILWMPIAGYESDPPTTHWPISVPSEWPAPNNDYQVWGYGWDMVNPNFVTPFINLDTVKPGTIEIFTNPGFPDEIYSLALWTSGLPARSMRAEHRYANAPWERRWAWHKPAELSWIHAQMDRLVPLRPIWPGFAINTIIYTAILLMLFAPFTARRMIRRNRGLCIKCGYDLGYAEHEVCPECGAGVS